MYRISQNKRDDTPTYVQEVAYKYTTAQTLPVGIMHRVIIFFAQ